MFCFNCGCKLPDDSMFCFKCGAKINRDIKVESGDTSLCYLYNGTIPPTPLSEISDVWVWSLATIPIFLSIVLGKYDFPYLALAIIMIVLNCLFLSLDIKALRKSGL